MHRRYFMRHSALCGTIPSFSLVLFYYVCRLFGKLGLWNGRDNLPEPILTSPLCCMNIVSHVKFP